MEPEGHSFERWEGQRHREKRMIKEKRLSAADMLKHEMKKGRQTWIAGSTSPRACTQEEKNMHNCIQMRNFVI